MLAGFFLKKVVFSFSESGLFFSFSLFLCWTCCKGVVGFKIVVNLDCLGCQHLNEQLRFFKILEYTGRYGFPEILIEVRAAFLELALRKNPRRILAESEEKTSHRFGIVVLKTEISVSRPIENSGVEWV